MNKDKFEAGTIWITGISASGKSTLGSSLVQSLKDYGLEEIIFLDGEDIRKRLEQEGKYFGHSNKDRSCIFSEIADLAINYNRKGYVCIVSAIAHVKKEREAVRQKVKNYMEVYLECSVEACAKRDYKGNYEKAYAGLMDNFIGVNEPFQISDNTELIINTEKNDIENCGNILFRETIKYLFNGKEI